MIIENSNFILEHIASSGQCFRMNKTGDTQYSVIAEGKYLSLNQLNENEVELSCTEEEFQEFWSEYFDLSYDYESIVKNLLAGDDEFLKKAAAYGYGLRILKQDIFEALITFIISQRKSIPAIKGCVEQICQRFGEKRVDMVSGIIYYTFPTPVKLAEAAKEELREAGLGYRDEYVRKTALAVAKGEIALQNLKALSYEEVLGEFMKLPGVGIKVANCAALYGLHRIDAFPIDVWIERILKEVYENKFDVNTYKGYAGIIQQYMFYYIRSLS